ncbi:hypothetical protein [Sphingobacterium hungaricum]|uniref:Uncharacterized protein n=1 Tax=Sphingobacterium hungaricum TaxID=2082723 RepID=A0A928V3I9_9SPHI|nr:hypothetical protein [Sphingobacterium hungaricum]MBE8715459.1 hypothetical protein [Sphingobacterium hungaricum]
MIRLFILVIITFELSAQEYVPAKYASSGSQGIADSGIYTLAGNPAGVSRINRPQLALGYQQHFLGTDIQSQALFFAMPIKAQGGLGLLIENYGIPEVTSLIKSGFTFSKYFGKQINASLSINYHQYHVESYTTSKSWSADLGFQYLFEKVQLGAVFKNISGSTFSNEIPEAIDQEIAFGALYYLSDEIQVLAELSNDFDSSIKYSAGLAYKIHKQIILRGGASSLPVEFHAGAGILVKKFIVDVASSFHTQLGSSPQLAIAYEF